MKKDTFNNQNGAFVTKRAPQEEFLKYVLQEDEKLFKWKVENARRNK